MLDALERLRVDDFDLDAALRLPLEVVEDLARVVEAELLDAVPLDELRPFAEREPDAFVDFFAADLLLDWLLRELFID